MPNAGDGQYEMVLENRHVMILFFVVVILCGVFFGLGYIVGKNAIAVQAAAAGENQVAGETKKSPLEPAAEKKPPPESTADLTFQKTLAEKNASPALEGAAATQQPVPEQPRPVERAPASPAAVPAPAQTHPDAGNVRLQVAASRNRTDADATAGLLRKKSFPVSVELQSDNLYHVLVTASVSDVEDLKTRLEKEGFKAFVKKR